MLWLLLRLLSRPCQFFKPTLQVLPFAAFVFKSLSRDVRTFVSDWISRRRWFLVFIARIRHSRTLRRLLIWLSRLLRRCRCWLTTQDVVKVGQFVLTHVLSPYRPCRRRHVF